MNDTEKRKIIDRVRKILALAGNNPNENEAAVAAEKAQAMLAEYNLSMAEVGTEKRAERDFDRDNELLTDSVPWRRSLALMVARLYFCEYFFTHVKKPTSARSCGYIRYDRHTFVGEPHNLAVAKMMFTYLNTTVEHLAASGAMNVAVSERSSYRTSFKHACASRLCWRIQDRIEAAKRGEVKTASGTNLPACLDLYDQTKRELREYIEKTVGRLRETKSKRTMSNVRGAMDGDAAGKSIGLDKQVGASGATHRIGHVA